MERVVEGMRDLEVIAARLGTLGERGVERKRRVRSLCAVEGGLGGAREERWEEMWVRRVRWAGLEVMAVVETLERKIVREDFSRSIAEFGVKVSC